MPARRVVASVALALTVALAPGAGFAKPLGMGATAKGSRPAYVYLVYASRVDSVAVALAGGAPDSARTFGAALAHTADLLLAGNADPGAVPDALSATPSPWSVRANGFADLDGDPTAGSMRFSGSLSLARSWRPAGFQVSGGGDYNRARYPIEGEGVLISRFCEAFGTAGGELRFGPYLSAGSSVRDTWARFGTNASLQWTWTHGAELHARSSGIELPPVALRIQHITIHTITDLPDGTHLRDAQRLGQLALTVQRFHEGTYLSATLRSRFQHFESKQRWWQGEVNASVPLTQHLALNVNLTATHGDAGRFAAQEWSDNSEFEYRGSVGLTLWRGMGREDSPLLLGQ